MDIFSFLPIVIFIYAIATIFNPGNKSPNKRRQGPQQGSGQSPSQFPAPKTWREKMEELERELFPKEEDQRQQTRRTQQPSAQTEWTQERPDLVRTNPFEDQPSSEGYATEGYAGIEGSSGIEGTWGTEGTSRMEGSPNNKGIQNRREPLSGTPKKDRIEKPQQPMNFPGINSGSLMQGVIWAEVLGKPRARNGWNYGKRQ